MSNPNNHSDSTLSAKIEAYLADELSNKERHQLEKAMLDDPFLADALEGLTLIKDSKKRKAAFLAIRQKLGTIKQNTGFWSNYQQYAAAAVLVLMLGTGYYLKDYFIPQGNEENLSEVSKIEEDNSKNQAIEEESEVIQDAQQEEVIKLAEKKEELRNIVKQELTESQFDEDAEMIEQPTASKNEPMNNSISSGMAQQEKVAQTQNEAVINKDTELAENTTVEELVEADDEIWDNGFGVASEISDSRNLALDSSQSLAMEKRATQQKSIKEISAKSKKNILGKEKKAELASVQNRLITGSITDAENNPLPGVSILLKGEVIGTTTDLDGNFSLTAPSENQVLSINFIGFETEEVVLEKGDNELQITLDQDLASLEEVVVVGYGQNRKQNNETGSVTTLDRKDLGLPVTVTYPSPVGGMKAFKDYLVTNLKYPQKALKAGISGNVKLGFTISENGKVNNIEVLRSLGYGCDEEAIRLLKNGPDWNPKTVEGTPERGERTIKIKFKQD